MGVKFINGAIGLQTDAGFRYALATYQRCLSLITPAGVYLCNFHSRLEIYFIVMFKAFGVEKDDATVVEVEGGTCLWTAGYLLP